MRTNNIPQRASNGQAITVVLVSGLSILREGMKRILLQQDDIEVVAEVSHVHEVPCNEALRLADVVVVVVNPTSSEGNDYLLSLRRENPSLRIIIITRSPTLHQILSILRAGVRGLLNASCAANHLPCAIRAVSSGKLYLQEEVSRLIATDLGELGRDHTHTALTPRELEVFMKLAAGHKVSEIGLALGINIKTVSTHKARLMEKMGFTTSSQIIQYAIVNDMFDTLPSA